MKSLNITIPFTKDITQMHSYAKFLKEILSNKKKLEDNETVMLIAECSALIQNDIRPKLKEPGSFSIPCVIGKFVIDKALCDLEASVSLIPLSIYEKLKLGELRPTRMSLKLTGRSVKFHVGMLENIPMQIGQFYIPTNFIIMDINEDSNIPIILGRPFLATAGAIIDVKRGKLTFEVGEEKIEFILSQFMKAHATDETSCFIDIIDKCIREMEMEAPKDTEVLKILAPPIFEDDEWRIPYVDDSLRECFTLTPNPMPFPKKPFIELKTLTQKLRYEFLDKKLERPVIVNADLSQKETEQLLDVLRKYSTPLGYNILDLKGINPSMCMRRIMLEEDSKTSREPHRRINPIISDIVKREVLGIIYPIFDSKWVSPVHVVPKKGGVTVVKNDKDGVVEKRVEIKWRM